MNSFHHGFFDELEKKAGIGSMLGGKALANALAHVVINTKVSPRVLRDWVANAGDDVMAAGFRHAIQGKKVKAIPQALIGTAISPSVPYMYQTGYKYGRRVHETMRKVPLVGAQAPFKLMRAADTGVSTALKHAPVGGAAGGASYGYLTGKTKKEKLPIKAMLAGALTGGLLGKGLKHYGPHAPGPKQLKWVRTKVVDPVLSGSQSRVGKSLDAIATKTKG